MELSVEEKKSQGLVNSVTSPAMHEGRSLAASTELASAADVEAFVHEYYEAWGGTNLDRIMSYYAEDVVLQIPGLLMEGKKAVRDQFAVPFTTAFPGNRHIVKGMIFGPGVVNVEFIFEAQHKGPFAGHAATGARVKLPGCGVYQYDSAKRQITAGRIYFDVGTLLQTITDSLLGDRKKTEEALRTNERNLSLITNVIPTFIHVLRTDGSVLYANQAVLGYTGLTLEEVRKEDYRARVFHPEDVERLREERRVALARPVPFENEQRVLGKDGKYRWFLIRFNPLLDAQGRVDRWYVAAFDIEDRKRVEEALQASRRKLSAIVNTIPTAAWTTRPDGYCDFLNQVWLDYAGMIAEKAEGWGWAEAIHPEDRERLVETWQSCLASGTPVDTEARIRRFDASYRWFLIRANPLRDESGNILKWYGTCIDIEDRKLGEETLRARELSWRQIVDNIPGLVATTGALGEVEFLNRQTLEYFGKTNEELKNWALIGAVHPDDLPRVIQARKKSIEAGQIYEIEHRCQGADGIYRWFQVRGLPVRDEEGRITAWYLLLTDIDDRKRAEDALARHAGVRGDVSAAFSKPANLGEILRGCTEAIVRHLDAAFARIWMLNKDQTMLELQASAGMYTRLDGSYSRIPVGDLKVGLIAREKKAHFTNDVVDDPRVHDKAWARVNGMVAFAGYPLVVEDRLIGVVALFARRPLAESTLDTLASVADTIAQGIERKRAEEDLRRSEFYLTEGQRLGHAGSWSFKPDLTCDYWSGELYEILGFDPGNGIPTIPEYFTRIHPQDRELVEATIRRMVAAGEGCDLKKRIIRPDGAQRVIRCVGMPIREQGAVTRFVGTLVDITEQEELTQELSQSEAYLAEAQRLSQTGSWAWSPDQDIRYWSEECYRVLSFNPLDGLPRFEEFFHRIHPDDQPGFRKLIQTAIREKAEWEADYRIVHPAGAVRDIHVVGHPVLSTSGHLVEFVGTVIDVTERKRAEAALQETRAELERVSRVTMMGELAASIAHEVNQPLAGVVTSANAGLNWLAANPPNLSKTREAMERILRDGTRGGEVLARIRALLKRAPPAKTLVGMNQTLQDVLALTAGELRQHNIRLSLELAPKLPAVLGDAVQLQQVLLNLIKNAIEAMAGIANGERTLRIQSRPGELDGKPAAVVEVSDTGVGFSGTDCSQLFEAFHTTKPQGMGMGLWISRSIIENHRGRLTASANNGPGATFVIMLPKAEQEGTEETEAEQ